MSVDLTFMPFDMQRKVLRLLACLGVARMTARVVQLVLPFMLKGVCLTLSFVVCSRVWGLIIG